MMNSIWLTAGDVVPCDNGHFQIPLRSLNHSQDLSAVVLKVASDAFSDVDEAEAFAELLATTWNARLTGLHT